MSAERSYFSESCEQLCSFFGVFYRQIPTVSELPTELEKLQRLVSMKRGQDAKIAIHQSALTEKDSHYKVIQSFLKSGKIGTLRNTSITNYFSNYILESIEEYHHDLIVIMASDPDDIDWHSPDRKGHTGGYPIIPYDFEVFGKPIDKLNNPGITHVPPDRILGFYYIK